MTWLRALLVDIRDRFTVAIVADSCRMWDDR